MSEMGTTKRDQQQPPAPLKYGRGRHPNSRRNLALGAWQPGTSGNVAGRPPKTEAINRDSSPSQVPTPTPSVDERKLEWIRSKLAEAGT